MKLERSGSRTISYSKAVSVSLTVSWPVLLFYWTVWPKVCPESIPVEMSVLRTVPSEAFEECTMIHSNAKKESSVATVSSIPRVKTSATMLTKQSLLR